MRTSMTHTPSLKYFFLQPLININTDNHDTHTLSHIKTHFGMNNLPVPPKYTVIPQPQSWAEKNKLVYQGVGLHVIIPQTCVLFSSQSNRQCAHENRRNTNYILPFPATTKCIKLELQKGLNRAKG